MSKAAYSATPKSTHHHGVTSPHSNSRMSLKSEKHKTLKAAAEDTASQKAAQSWKLMPPTPVRQQVMNQTLQKSIEIIKDRLYWYCNSDPPKNVPDSFFFNIDSVLVYQGYNKDFGPLNLAQLHRYCIELYRILKDKKYAGIRIFHHSSPTFNKKANACFLMCAFLVVCFKLTAEQAWQPFAKAMAGKLVPFVDAGEEPGDYECTVLDCLKGLEKAIEYGWYEFRKFDYKQYENFHKLDVGDMNWVIPGKIVAFSSPTQKKNDGLPPEAFIENFLKMKITAIVRLNDPLYKADQFEANGIAVIDLEFEDGSCPPDAVIRRFIAICDAEFEKGGAVAVHCRAGLGRTGTLIGCYIMSKYQVEPRGLIGWLRISRPGSVIGHQQQFLSEVYPRLSSIIERQKNPFQEVQNVVYFWTPIGTELSAKAPHISNEQKEDGSVFEEASIQSKEHCADCMVREGACALYLIVCAPLETVGGYLEHHKLSFLQRYNFAYGCFQYVALLSATKKI